MRALLDESVPIRLAKALAGRGCQVSPFPTNWKGLKNGELLRHLREQNVVCLITCDKNLRFQQAVARSGVGLVVLPRQRFGDLEPLLETIAAATTSATAGTVKIVNIDGTTSSG
ncbi:MAG: hypothetical protein ACK4U0_15055 [Mesorhizobium sp.]